MLSLGLILLYLIKKLWDAEDDKDKYYYQYKCCGNTLGRKIEVEKNY